MKPGDKVWWVDACFEEDVDVREATICDIATDDDSHWLRVDGVEWEVKAMRSRLFERRHDAQREAARIMHSAAMEIHERVRDMLEAAAN